MHPTLLKYILLLPFLSDFDLVVVDRGTVVVVKNIYVPVFNKNVHRANQINK